MMVSAYVFFTYFDTTGSVRKTYGYGLVQEFEKISITCEEYVMVERLSKLN